MTMPTVFFVSFPILTVSTVGAAPFTVVTNISARLAITAERPARGIIITVVIRFSRSLHTGQQRFESQKPPTPRPRRLPLPGRIRGQRRERHRSENKESNTSQTQRHQSHLMELEP